MNPISIRVGECTLSFEPETGAFTGSTHALSPEAILTPCVIDSWVFFHALRLLFEEGRDGDATGEVVAAGKEQGTSWCYLMPLVEPVKRTPPKIWLCIGPSSHYIPQLRMRKVFIDMKAAITKARMEHGKTLALFSPANCPQRSSGLEEVWTM